MIQASKSCSNLADKQIGEELTGKTIDQCEKACSVLDQCERFAYGRESTSALKKCILIKSGCVLTDSPDYNLFYPRVRVLEIPNTTKDSCTHLDLFQKQQPIIDFCKAKTSDKAACKEVAFKGRAQKFGDKSSCLNGGTKIDKGAGFNEYTCFDECKKAGKAICNNYLITETGNCELYAGTC